MEIDILAAGELLAKPAPTSRRLATRPRSTIRTVVGPVIRLRIPSRNHCNPISSSSPPAKFRLLLVWGAPRNGPRRFRWAYVTANPQVPSDVTWEVVIVNDNSTDHILTTL